MKRNTIKTIFHRNKMSKCVVLRFGDGSMDREIEFVCIVYCALFFSHGDTKYIGFHWNLESAVFYFVE
jgi:hypothetical protein